MDFALLALIAALGTKLVDTYRAAEKKDWKTVRIQVATWALGVALMFLASASDWAATVSINDTPLSDINSASKVLAGMALLSVASVFHDVTKNVGTTKEPQVINVTNEPKPEIIQVFESPEEVPEESY